MIRPLTPRPSPFCFPHFRCLLLSALCAVLSFLPLLVMDDGILLFMSDYSEQQIPFGMYINDAIKSGNVFWSHEMDLGTNFIGAFSFYLLGSPFYWLSLLFPSSWYLYTSALIYVLKYMIAALSAFFWLRRHLEQETTAVACSLMYAFSGFTATNLLFSHFHDVVALFPILLLALDLWVQEEKRWPLALASFVNLLTNYVFFIGEVIFLALYYVIRFLVPRFRHSLQKLPGCILLGGTGVLMGAILFVPSVLFLLNNPRTGERSFNLFFSLEQYLMLLRGALLPGVEMHSPDVLVKNDWSSCALWLPLGGLLLAVLYCAKAQPKDWLRRILVLCLILSLSPSLNGVFLLWTQNEYRRWFYMPLLLAALAAGRVLEQPQKYPVRRGVLCALALILCASIAVLAAPEVLNRPQLFAWNNLLAVTALLALLPVTSRQMRRPRAALALVCVFSILSTGTSAVLYHEDREVDGVRYSQELTAAAQLSVPEGYRIHTSTNHWILPARLMNSNTFCSTVSGGIFEFYDLLGTARGVNSPSSLEGQNELLSAGYSIQEFVWENCIPASEAHVGEVDFYVYHDASVPPIGFAYHTYMTRSEFSRIDPELRCLAMLRTLVIRDEDVTLVDDILRHYDPATDGSYAPEDKSALVALRASEAAISWEYGRRSFASAIPCSSPGYAFYSFPYDNGWSAKVNGEPVGILNVCGLMAVPVQAGMNQVVFRYTPPGLAIGTLLSLCGWATFCLLVRYEHRRRRALF